jgi:ubiquinone/menaquinone biosynthesis C-methylase UbiE
MLIDLLVREEWQDGDEFASLLREAAPELTGASVLEVGCSTGRRLRTLEGSGTRLGVDHDALAVALGGRLARHEGQSVKFHCCSATALPFADATFDLIVCRNALTYMHQRTALREMTRVLRPDGVLFLRVENFRYDLHRLSALREAKAFLAHTRHLFIGLALATTGYQPELGGFWGWRAFATKRHLRKTLRQVRCHIVRVEEAQNTARFLGRSVQTSLLARKAR